MNRMYFVTINLGLSWTRWDFAALWIQIRWGISRPFRGGTIWRQTDLNWLKSEPSVDLVIQMLSVREMFWLWRLMLCGTRLRRINYEGRAIVERARCDESPVHVCNCMMLLKTNYLRWEFLVPLLSCSTLAGIFQHSEHSRLLPVPKYQLLYNEN